MSGALYQLYPHQFKTLPSGALRIDGSWDTYGLKIKDQDNGTVLIRGTGRVERALFTKPDDRVVSVPVIK